MITNFRHIILSLIIGASTGWPVFTMAQDNTTNAITPITIEPLFEYPTAPEDLTNLTDKSNYLIDHFWDTLDFKSEKALDQNALNDAFRVYSVPMQWASKDNVMKSTDKILAACAKNPTLLLQFTKAAEEVLYGPRAQMWIDEIYVKYLDALVRNKKISESRKLRYERQLNQLTSSAADAVAPSFMFTDTEGKEQTYKPNGVVTVIEFGNPDCDDCRHTKLKMDTDVSFSSVVEKGLINVLFIVPDADDDWKEKIGTLPKGWKGGASEEVSDIYDIRLTPTLYVIGKSGKIIAKNIPVATAMELAKQAAAENK